MVKEDNAGRRSVEPFVERFATDQSVASVAEFLASDELRVDHQEAYPYDDGAIWAPDVARSVARKTHGWFFLRFWYSCWQELPEADRLAIQSKMINMIETWASKKADSDMAFHDETTAQRLINFTVFNSIANDDLEPNLKRLIEETIDSDFELLLTDSFYAGNNNHGMFQNIAIMVADAYESTRNITSADITKAIQRIEHYFETSFNSDGIHIENNPSYHMMVSRYLRDYLYYAETQKASTPSSEIAHTMKLADEYAAFALAPDNRFVPISDTKRNTINETSAERAFGLNKTTAVLTSGEKGDLPESNTFVAEESGYAIYRSSWDEYADYLFFSSAYNADYHKHSDENSLYYYARGREILAESGPNGYQYEDPLTQYAFSSAAHNTLLVNGQGLPRVDSKAALTTLRDNGTTRESLDVTGTTQRYDGIQWQRTVTVSPETSGETVEIKDFIDARSEHRYTFLWHLGLGLTPVVRGNAIEIFDEDDIKLAELTWNEPSTSVRAVKGQKHPYVQGWSFPKMGEARGSYSIEVEFLASGLEVEWTLKSTDFLLVDRGVTPQSDWQTFEGEKPVRYLLEGADDPSAIDSLAVVFTAVGQLHDFTYNYRASLADYPGATLYVLDDFGDQGAYYLASHRSFVEFRSVQGMLRSVISSLNLDPKQVTTIGSSKGGTAALLHGVTLGVGQVLAGAPQYKVGDFLSDPHPNILEYISGGTAQSDVNWINDTVRQVFRSGVRSTSVAVVVGEEDPHHRRHAIPLIDDLRSFGFNAELLAVPGTPHAELSGVFRLFLASYINSGLDGEFILPTATAIDPKSGQVGVAVLAPEGSLVQAQLLFDGQRSGPPVAVRRGGVKWKVDKPGIYRTRVYVDLPGDEDRKAYGTAPLRL